MQLDAIRADRAASEFRGYPPSAIDQLKEQLGDKIVVQQSDWNCPVGAWINHQRKPFDDVRVRRALVLSLDHWGRASNSHQPRRCQFRKYQQLFVSTERQKQ